MNAGDKYEAFRNFMFNELGISKEEIRTWIREAVVEQVIVLLKQQDGKFDTKEVNQELVKKQLFSSWNSEQAWRIAISKEIAEKLTVKVE